MTIYKILFQDNHLLLYVDAESAKEARRIFDKQISVRRVED